MTDQELDDFGPTYDGPPEEPEDDHYYDPEDDYDYDDYEDKVDNTDKPF